MAFGFGGSSAKESSNFNQNTAFTPQWNDYYNNLNSQWGASQPMMNLGMGQMNMAQPYMNQAANTGQQGANYMMGGGSYGDTSGMRNNLYSSLQNSMSNPSSMGRMYQDIVGGPGNTYIDPMVASMRQSGNQALDRANAGNAADAANYGQSGSSRQAMQNSMNTSQANMDMAGLENQMRGNAYNTDLNWKMGIAQQADLGRGQAQDRAMGVLGGGDANRQMGMNYMPTQQNLGMGTMAPWMQAMYAPWNMANMYGTAMGDPTIVGSGSSKGKSGSLGLSM